MSDQDDARERLRTLATNEPPAWIHTGDLIYKGRLALRRRRRWQLRTAMATVAIVAVGAACGALPLLNRESEPFDIASAIFGLPQTPSPTPSASATVEPERAMDMTEAVGRAELVISEHLDPAQEHLRPADGRHDVTSAYGEGAVEGIWLRRKWKEGSREADVVLEISKDDSQVLSLPGAAHFKGEFCGPMPTNLRWTSCGARRLSDGSELRVGQARAAGRTMALTATHKRTNGTRVSVTFALGKSSPQNSLEWLPFPADDLIVVATDPRISLGP